MACSATIFRGTSEWLSGVALLIVLLLPPVAASQAAGSFGHPDESRIIYRTAPNTGIVTFKVYAERNGARLNRQALVKLVNVANQNATWQPTGDNSQGVFTDVPYGDYTAEVSAVGYLSSHQDVKVVSVRNILEFDVVLHRDPSAVNLDVADTLLSAKARKEAKRAVSALKSGNLKDAQKELESAYQSAPSSPELNFLLGYLYFQKKDFLKAASYLGTATTLNPHNGQGCVVAGWRRPKRAEENNLRRFEFLRASRRSFANSAVKGFSL